MDILIMLYANEVKDRESPELLLFAGTKGSQFVSTYNKLRAKVTCVCC